MTELLKIRIGSHLYGTNTESSDEDFASIHIGDEDYYFGLYDRKDEIDNSIISKSIDGKNTSDAIDDKSYEIKKYVKLALKSNPNILEILFVDNKNKIYSNEFGEELLKNRFLFPSKMTFDSFLGYASSQKHKMIIRKDHFNELRNAHMFFEYDKKNYQFLMEYKNDVDFIVEDKQHFKIGDLQFQKHIMTKKAIKILKERLSKITNRSELVLKYGFDTKFASHLIRLLDEGKQILETGEISFPIRMKQEVLDIKLGKYNLNYVMQLANEMEQDMMQLKIKSELPDVPDFKKVNNLVKNLVMDFYKQEWNLS